MHHLIFYISLEVYDLFYFCIKKKYYINNFKIVFVILYYFFDNGWKRRYKRNYANNAQRFIRKIIDYRKTFGKRQKCDSDINGITYN
jgi:hypothetical protein